jgi:hypothetical protein
MYAANGFGTSSLKFKSNVVELDNSDLNECLRKLNKIQTITYQWNKSLLEKEKGNFVDGKFHSAGEKPDPNQIVPTWLGFSVESLPEGTVDETGENYQYGAVLGLIIASTKALSNKVDTLSNDVKSVKNDNPSSENNLLIEIENLKKQNQELSEQIKIMNERLLKLEKN